MRRITKNLLNNLELQAQLKTNLFQIESKKIGLYDIEGNLSKVIDVEGKEYPLETLQDIKLCNIFLPLLDESLRYVSLRGGRGSAKSMAVAIYLLLYAMVNPIRILCFREVQSSIKESVYALLQQLISELGLSQFYESTLTEIRGVNGSLFMFKGLSDYTADSIKSLQGINIAWGEEAATLTENSLQILLPTIREEGSRIIFTWNPSLDTDAVYQRYVMNPPSNCCSLEINYKDNPFFPQVLEGERANDQQRLSQPEYANIWEGKILPAKQGAVYFKEVTDTIEQKRITDFKYDPQIPVHIFMDLGMADSTAIILVQKTFSEIRIIDYFEDNRKSLEHYNNLLDNLEISNWGTMYLPHDARHQSLQTGMSTQEIFEKFGWTTEIVPNLRIEEGIRAARQMFQMCYFNKDKTTRLIECLKRYSYSQKHDSFGRPIHDSSSHGADAFRYLAVMYEKLSNSSRQASLYSGPLSYKKNTVY